MPRRNIPVFEYDGKRRLYFTSRDRAQDMLQRGVVFLLSESPLIVALSKPPQSREDRVGVGRKDRSLTMPPSVICGAAEDIPGDIAIVGAWRCPRLTPQVDEELTHATAERAVLYMPGIAKGTEGRNGKGL